MSILWLTSPNLGQTSFWIVGATNYIWTNLFVLMVLDKLARNLKNSENERFSLLGIFLLSIVAACGNENISLVLVGTTFIFCAFSYIYNKTSIRIGLSSFAGSCIGAGILLLAPVITEECLWRETGGKMLHGGIRYGYGRSKKCLSSLLLMHL
jgi:hypothetical protein